MLNSKIHIAHSLEDTTNLANKLASIIQQNKLYLKIAFNGELGAGKTTFIRSMILYLGINSSVKSPTFTIVEPYETDMFDIYHFDLYRFNDPEEWYYAGFDEYITSNSLCFIEWAANAKDIVYPYLDLVIDIQVQEESREYRFNVLSELGALCLNQLI